MAGKNNKKSTSDEDQAIIDLTGEELSEEELLGIGKAKKPAKGKAKKKNNCGCSFKIPYSTYC